MALPAWIGCDAEPADESGSSVADYTYIFDEAHNQGAGFITRIEVYVDDYSGGVMDFAVFRNVSGDSFIDDHAVLALSIANGLNVFTSPGDFDASDLPIEDGEYIGWYLTSDGLIDKATSGGPGYRYDSGDQISATPAASTFTTSGNTTHEFQIRAYVEETATTAAPTTVAPTTVAPTTLPPTTLPPTTLAPTTLPPTTIAPTTLPPTTVAPTTLPPTTIAPTTLPPTTLPPTTLAPTSLPPTTVPPTTVPPTTSQPTTPSPTTVSPTTIAPTTLPPTTLAPTTAPVLTTLSPTTAPPYECIKELSSEITRLIRLNSIIVNEVELTSKITREIRLDGDICW